MNELLKIKMIILDETEEIILWIIDLKSESV